MSDRTKLTMVSLAVMMLPYRIDFPVAFLFVTAMTCAALDIALESWSQRQVSRNFIAALSLYRRLKYRPLSDYQSATG